MTGFIQDGPELENEFKQDFLLQAFLKSRFSKEAYPEIESDLIRFGSEVSGPLLKLAAQAELEQPRLVQFDPWGRRIDEIEVSSAWKELDKLSAEERLVSIAYERKWGSLSRLYQFAKLYLFHTSSAFYTCPLAMTDGAARVLELSGSKESVLVDALKHLTSCNPTEFWTSGQWMTEKTGGSDVSQSRTSAKRVGDHFELTGEKWFSSATTSQMALGLARIEGAPAGSKGLSLFYIPMRRVDGSLNGIQILRLKDKLGTKALPTAELKLEGTKAWLVGKEGDGVKSVATMLNITRLYNSISSVSQMRRVLALSRSYSVRRKAFGKVLSEQPLHIATLGEEYSDWAKASVLTWQMAHLLGKEEVGESLPEESLLLRLLTPVAKLWTAKLAISVTSEGIESFGGAGYIEDTGLPMLLRNAQVFSIWEGTTNVLSLDVLRVLEKSPEALKTLVDEVIKLTQGLKSSFPELAAQMEQDRNEFLEWVGWLKTTDSDVLQAHARKLSFRMAELYSRALLVDLYHKQPSIKPLRALIERMSIEKLSRLQRRSKEVLDWDRELIF